MLSEHIHQALHQVRELQANILEKQRFKGYSGWARAIAGTIAFGSTIVMSMSFYPSTVNAHLCGWLSILLFGLGLNYGSLIHWFLFDATVKRDARRLKPVIDGMPPLLVGGFLSLAMIQSEQYHYLFGIWFAMFGLANLASRHVLPKSIGWVGLFYVICGAVFILVPEILFLNPLPAGIVLLIGEWGGGGIIHCDGKLANALGQTSAIE